METLILRGVRCFDEEVRLPIRPVTLLVGENSTGKSTVLAMARAAWDIAYRQGEPDFNEEPFDLGSYDTIAHYHGGQGKRVHEFSVGGTFGTRGSSRAPAREVRGVFQDELGQAVLSRWEVIQGDDRLEVRRKKSSWAVRLGDGSEYPLAEQFSAPTGLPIGDLAWFGLQRSNKKLPEDVQRWVFSALRHRDREPRPIAGAPIRSKPIRTYDPKKETHQPEGAHVPMRLATMKATGVDDYDALAKELAAYANDAHLFTKLDVKRLGKKPGDPFQLRVAVDKLPFNLRDVGYGVSQVLPILFDSLTAPKGQTFLLQQPEVHLHPRAQAALGSFAVDQAAKRAQTFVIETHSDHLIDRVRMDVRDKKGLHPNQVVILYFERVAGRAQVYPIHIDELGNLVGQPQSYRSFFLEEERRLLGL